MTENTVIKDITAFTGTIDKKHVLVNGIYQPFETSYGRYTAKFFATFLDEVAAEAYLRGFVFKSHTSDRDISATLQPTQERYEGNKLTLASTSLLHGYHVQLALHFKGHKIPFTPRNEKRLDDKGCAIDTLVMPEAREHDARVYLGLPEKVKHLDLAPKTYVVPQPVLGTE